MQAGVSVEIHSACASEDGERGGIAGEYKRSYPQFAVNVFVCLHNAPTSLQCTKKAVKVKKV